ncbi:hypothetical protein BDV27DRAFT_30341 [Aspergillus caelatus]|uniref:Uncharacterized protein n=1 Tax=Aspergillus caelatus TaxID=61420 RepID=A0A5N7AJK5_9EURO|nr:uncharacterized protein BDV27DRAFT_30341 [Aspergillus caelatus]KAE8368840.1 hypothetical protein BDV27DRAFT_30341 [Aspergillus caelatus]
MSETRSGTNCDDQNPCDMVELNLITQLRSAATKTEGDVGTLLSGDMVECLLRDETPLKTSNVNDILSALDKNASQIIQSLDATSLQCLAYLLLNSGTQAGQERGLYLLLDGPRSCAKDESAAVLPTDYSRLIQERLLNVLYRIFIDGHRNDELRRLTGKLLAELMLGPGEEGALLLKSQDILQSIEDLPELRKALIKAGGEIKMSASTIKSKSQRSSSAVVSLDTAEVVVRKSKRLSEARARKEADTVKHTLPPSMSPSMSPASGTHFLAATVSNTVSSDGSQKGNGEHEPIGGGDGCLLNVTDKDMNNPQLDSLFQNKEHKPNRVYDNSMASEKGSDQDGGAHTISQAKRSTEPQQFRSNETAATANQNRQLMSRRNRSTLSLNKRNKPQLSNTQESLIFHPQRAYRRVYAAHRKAAVDWDEDLRPSGESELNRGNEFGEASSFTGNRRRPLVQSISSGGDHEDDARPYVTDANASGPSKAPPKPRLLGAKHIGRGQGIGEKLAAAFQLEEVSSQCKRYHNQENDAPPDHKSQSNPETTASPAPSIEKLAREDLFDKLYLLGNSEDEDGDYALSRSSDTDRLLDLCIGQKRPDEVRETRQNNCQGVLGDTEMISASIETVATELLGDGRWETETAADGSMSPTNSTQGRHAQPCHGDTPIIRSDHSSSISTSKAANNRPCSGSDQPDPGPESSCVIRAAILEHGGPVSAKSLLRHDSQQAQEHTAEHQRTTPRKSIVDPNGSPRHVLHTEHKLMISDGTVHCKGQSGQLTQDEKQSPAGSIDDESGYDGGIEESFVEVSDARDTLVPTACGQSSGVRIENPFAQGPSLPRGCEGQTRSVRRDHFRAVSALHRQHRRIDIADQGPYQSPSQGELASIDSSQNTAITSSTHGKNFKQTKGVTTLQTLQRYTQGMLLESRKRLRSKQSMVSWKHIADSATACSINFSKHKKNE